MTENLHRLVVVPLPRCEVWRDSCSGSGAPVSSPTWFCRAVSSGACADFQMHCRPDLCLCGTSALQITFFCTSKLAFLRHLCQSDLSVNTVLSLSMSFSVFSDSQFHALHFSSVTCFFHLLFLVLLRPELISFKDSILELFFLWITVFPKH